MSEIVYNTVADKPVVDQQAMTAAIPAKPEIVPQFDSADSRDIGTLKAGLDALSDGDVPAARLYRDKLPDTSLDRHILVWAIAMSGRTEVSSSEIAMAARTLARWPGAEALRKNVEKALLREKAEPQTVIAAFGGQQAAYSRRRNGPDPSLSRDGQARSGARRAPAFLAHREAGSG